MNFSGACVETAGMAGAMIRKANANVRPDVAMAGRYVVRSGDVGRVARR